MGTEQNHTNFDEQNKEFWSGAQRPTPMGARCRTRRTGRCVRGILIVVLILAAIGGGIYLAQNLGVSLQRTPGGVVIALRSRQTQEPSQPSAAEDLQQTPEQQTPEAEKSGAAEAEDPQRPQLELSQSPAGAPTQVSDEPGALSLQQIYKKVIGSVVSIETVTQSGKASGTGIIMSEDGYLITNHHVIEDALAVSVLTSAGTEYTAELIGSDETSDLAVLKIGAQGLPAAEFGDSGALQVGDSVVAIGDPLGVQLRGTMTSGIVSAINRDLSVGERTMSLIQTDAALNSGNSGGPLINGYGQVVGINTMKIGVNYFGSSSVEGLGFAIPIASAKPIIDELIEKGYVSGRPAIGIKTGYMSVASRIYFHLPDGVYISYVYENSDAARKGLREGDIITAANGTAVTSEEKLNTVKNQFEAGDVITLTVYRGGVSFDVDVVLMDQASVS